MKILLSSLFLCSYAADMHDVRLPVKVPDEILPYHPVGTLDKRSAELTAYSLGQQLYSNFKVKNHSSISIRREDLIPFVAKPLPDGLQAFASQVFMMDLLRYRLEQMGKDGMEELSLCALRQLFAECKELEHPLALITIDVAILKWIVGMIRKGFGRVRVHPNILEGCFSLANLNGIGELCRPELLVVADHITNEINGDHAACCPAFLNIYLNMEDVEVKNKLKSHIKKVYGEHARKVGVLTNLLLENVDKAFLDELSLLTPMKIFKKIRKMLAFQKIFSLKVHCLSLNHPEHFNTKEYLVRLTGGYLLTESKKALGGCEYEFIKSLDLLKQHSDDGKVRRLVFFGEPTPYALAHRVMCLLNNGGPEALRACKGWSYVALAFRITIIDSTASSHLSQ